MNLSIAPCEFYSDESIGGDSAILHVLNDSSPLLYGNTFSTFGQQERRVSPSSQHFSLFEISYVTFSVKMGTG